jgi:nucleolar protein 53
MLASVTLAKSLRKSLEKGQVVHAQTLLERDAKLREKLRGGLGGSKLGRHRVGGEQIDVQLGEDLTESLRGLKASSSGIVY